MSDSTPFAFRDLSEDHLPYTITVHRVDNDEEVWRSVIETLPVVLWIPPIADEIGCPVWCRVEDGAGDVETWGPDGA